MTMLKKITVYGLFNENDFEIPLSGDCITYIHSRNGLGKSTIMKLVYSILAGELEEARTVPFERVDLDFDTGTSIIVENRNQELTVQASRNGLEENISIEDLRGIKRVVYIGPDRAYARDADGHLAMSLPLYMIRLSKRIQAAMRDSEPRKVPAGGEDRTDADIDRWFRDLEAKVEFIKQAGFAPEIPSGYRFPPSRYEIGEYRSDYLALAASLQDYVDRYYSFAESIVVYKDIINTIYIDKTVSLNEAGYFEARMDRSGTVVPLDKFSSGEKQMLIIFYLILFETEPGSLVILDEPEVSLHVTWQHELGRVLRDLCRLRSLQVLMATHAPSVIHDDWDLTTELKADRE